MSGLQDFYKTQNDPRTKKIGDSWSRSLGSITKIKNHIEIDEST